MSVYPAPANQQGEIFNPSLWIVSAINGVSVQYLDENYLRYPVAQGYETLNGMTNLSNGTFEKNIVMSGEYLTNYIQFPDGSQQFSADSGGGSGDAQLAGGTSTTPQVFTGYNEFSNASGQIILSNTSYSHIVSMTCDNTTNVKLDINGQVQIGNSVNSNTVSIQADTTNPNQFDIKGSLGLGNTLNSNSVILSSNNGSTTGCNVYGDIFIYNPSATKEIQLTSNTTTSHQLDINGQLTIGNTPPNGNTILLSADSTTVNQLDIAGQVSISSSTGGNTVILKSDDTTTGQLDVVGSCSVGGNLIVGNVNNSNTVSISADGGNANQLNLYNSSILVAGAGYPILLAGYGDSDLGKYGLQVSGGGIFVGNNGGAADSSYFVQIACSDASDGILFVNGNLNITGTSITLNGSTFTAGTTGLIINQPVTITTNLVLQGTVSGDTTSSTLSQSATIEETVQYDGSIQLSGGTTGRSIYLNYTGQTDLQIQQNFDEYLQVSTGLTLYPNKYSYPSSTNFVNMAADGATNNQLNIEGNLFTTGSIILGSGSSTPQAYLKFGDGSIQTVAYTGGAPILATYTSSALDTLLTPFVWSFDGISNTLGNQVGWILYSNSAITTNSSSTVFSETNATITPSDLNNYIYGSGTAIQIPYKFDNGTTTSNQKTYYPSVVVALGGFTLDAIGNTSGTTTFTVTLNSSSNTNFTNASTLKLVFYAG